MPQAPCTCAPATTLAAGGPSPDTNLVQGAANVQIVQAPAVTGVSGPLVVRLTDASGQPIDDMQVVHDAKLHLFSETTGAAGATQLRDFQHVHPPQPLGNGLWVLPQFQWHEAGIQHVVTNFTVNGVNTVGATSVAVQQGPTPADPAPDMTRGYAATFVGRGIGTASPSAVRIAFRRPDGAPITGNGELYSAQAHLIMFDTRGGGAATPLFAHGHAMRASSNGAFDIDLGVLAPGTYQGFLQYRTEDGAPVSLPVTIPWSG